MAYTRRIKLGFAVVSILLAGGILVGVAGALEKNQNDAIIQNCDNIKQSLVKLQHSDSRTRTYLGSAYEAVAGRLLTPLNLRLVKNGSPSADLIKNQNDFTIAQNDFRDKYVNYMRELEGLIATECKTHPEDFYVKLETTRTRRAELRTATQKLSDLVNAQTKLVEELKASLNAK